MRILIIGNSGSGKSTLARGLSKDYCRPAVSLDEIFWLPGGFNKARLPEEQDRLLQEAFVGKDWIVEGVFGRLIEMVVPLATHLVWMDLPWDLCRKGIVARHEDQGRSAADLLAWAEQYWEREGMTSHAGHHAPFLSFAEERRLRFTSWVEADEWLIGGAPFAA